MLDADRVRATAIITAVNGLIYIFRSMLRGELSPIIGFIAHIDVIDDLPVIKSRIISFLGRKEKARFRGDGNGLLRREEG